MQKYESDPVVSKRRYLAISISPVGFSRKHVLESVRGAIRAQGLDEREGRIRYLYCNDERGLLVMKCSHRIVDDVRLAIASIGSISGQNCQLKVVLTSGSLKRLRKVLGLPR